MEFSKTFKTKDMKRALSDAFDSGFWHGRGPYTRKVEKLLNERLGRDIWMTTSCTHALELAVRISGLGPGDEVIMPSFAYPSAANAVLLAGASIRYAPVEKNTYCLDVDCLKDRITDKTKAVIVIHYGGRSYKIGELAEFCRDKGLMLIEDAAQAFGSTVDGQALGTFGDYGAISFHSTKNVGCGEGGALIVSDRHRDKAHEIECFLEKGTDRAAFERGDREFYQWSALGSSYVPSDLLMAILYEGLKDFDEYNHARILAYRKYAGFFRNLNHPAIINHSNKNEDDHGGNAHLFFLVFRTKGEAQAFMEGMGERDISCYRHFYPLHASKYGECFNAQREDFPLEEHLGDALVRLPLYTDMTEEETCKVLRASAEVLGVMHD